MRVIRECNKSRAEGCGGQGVKKLDLTEALDTFDQLFSSARDHMFKAEVLQDYSTIDNLPSLHAWLDGDKAKSRKLGQKDPVIAAWREKCLKSPANITRVHVVSEPLTPYIQWEIDVIYKSSLIPSGAEVVLLAPLALLSGINLPEGDFWIFDSKHVLQWEYHSGRVAGGKVWNESDDVAAFVQLQQRLLKIAQPVG